VQNDQIADDKWFEQTQNGSGEAVPLDPDDIALLLRHLQLLRQLVTELDGLDAMPSAFHQRQEVRDRLRREIDVTQAAISAFASTDPRR
jgi:hypothetical protein